MNGCGKSSLVTEVLNDPLITMQYLQVIFYLLNVVKVNCEITNVNTILICFNVNKCLIV